MMTGSQMVENPQEKIARLEQWVQDLQSGMYINCVYCGHQYGPKDEVPMSMADVLKAHVEQCPEHPMSKLKARCELLEVANSNANALIGDQAEEHSKIIQRLEAENTRMLTELATPNQMLKVRADLAEARLEHEAEEDRAYMECEAGIDGGCGACKVCDPEWWDGKMKEEYNELRSKVCEAMEKVYANERLHVPKREDLNSPFPSQVAYVISALKFQCEELQKKLDADSSEGCPECGFGFRPEHIEVDEDMRRLVSWRDSLALDSYGDGLASEIQGKLSREDPDDPPDRVPEHLKETLRRYLAMDEAMQFSICFSVLGE